jgi:hypothetical protein
MKKFVVVALLLATCGVCVCAEEESNAQITISAGEYQDIFDKTCSVIEDLVRIYETDSENLKRPDVISAVDEKICELNEIITLQKIRKEIDFSWVVKAQLCSDWHPGFNMEEEQKIGEKIITRWRALRASAYIKSLKQDEDALGN